MYNPIELSEKTEKIVSKEDFKKYYRFRPTSFYGGIATADTVGCNLRCKFCWSGNSVWNAKNVGDFYSPEKVVDILQDIAQSKGYHQLRISGGEPTIGKKHLIRILENINSQYLFILETNGILLGYNESYAKELSRFRNLHVRVCLKGVNQEEFFMFTSAEDGFEYQMKALKYLREQRMSFNIALVSVKKDKKEFYNRLLEMGLNDIMIEKEEIKLYPLVRKRLYEEGLLHLFEQKQTRRLRKNSKGI